MLVGWMILVGSQNFDGLFSLGGQRGIHRDRISVSDDLGDVNRLLLDMCCGILIEEIHQADEFVELVD